MRWSGNEDPSKSFDLVTQLGRGHVFFIIYELTFHSAFSVVYRSIHKDTLFELAVKIVQMRRDSVTTLEKEIEVLKKCKSPNIVSYYGTLKKGDEFWVCFHSILPLT